ncbi:MAG: toll/interleukin-1 receptor domain-containing protein, partial [Pseudomonadota bacterium]
MSKARESDDSAGANGSRYDAFVSYAHEDKVTARWLAELLGDYWVPGRRRRSVFLDTTTLAAGRLKDEIREALEASQFLVVCGSRYAAASPWVAEEIRVFRELGREDRILACRVGAPGDDALPSGVAEIHQSLEGGLLISDLRGFNASLSKAERQTYIEAALALLARILGFANKKALLDTVVRRRQLIFR